jgi:VIT1/CCC1 family predicted Fe2+/Mn2+ transporter
MSEREQRESLGEALHRLGHDLGDLVRAELALFKSEIGGQLRSIGSVAIWLAAAGAFGMLAFGTFTAFLILALALILPAWGAALAVTAVYGIVTAGLLVAAKARLRDALPIKFEDTKQSVREDVAWIQSGMKSGIK